MRGTALRQVDPPVGAGGNRLQPTLAGRCDDWRAGLLTDDEILARLFHLNQQRAGRAGPAE
jgi:hypothetical protein